MTIWGINRMLWCCVLRALWEGGSEGNCDSLEVSLQGPRNEFSVTPKENFLRIWTQQSMWHSESHRGPKFHESPFAKPLFLAPNSERDTPSERHNSFGIGVDLVVASKRTNLETRHMHAHNGCARCRDSEGSEDPDARITKMGSPNWESLALLQGSFGPFGPKVANRVRKWVPGPSRPQGSKSPQRSRERVKINKFKTILTLFRLCFGLFGPQGRKGPGTHFRTLFATFGPKGPNDPCSRARFSQSPN